MYFLFAGWAPTTHTASIIEVMKRSLSTQNWSTELNLYTSLEKSRQPFFNICTV
jgi:hypothetical protein